MIMTISVYEPNYETKYICNRDIYLLDNPLSMVDADMAATIFNKCILNALHARTVILATQHIQVELTSQTV
jgi:ABC-type transport system involved in cytochrome c biogenesis ATPase subunit